MTPIEWLTQYRSDGRTNVSRLAELLMRSGGSPLNMTVEAFGPGLPPAEAVELAEMNGIMHGFEMALGPDATLPAIEAIRREVAARGGHMRVRRMAQ